MIPILTGSPPIRVVFLAGSDSRSVRSSIEAVCRIPGVIPAAILIDTHRNSLKIRLKNFRRNFRRNGWRYIPHRILNALRQYFDGLAERSVIGPSSVSSLLRKAFPDRCFTLDDVGRKFGSALHAVGNLNGPLAIAALIECNADLGIVLGTRILKATTFGIPRLGSINLHKGSVPEYRGMPPGFWELYDGAGTAGITVHFVDSNLDTGDVVETGKVAIEPLDTPESLTEKLHDEGERVLTRAVIAIQNGVAQPRKQGPTAARPRTLPTLRQVAVLKRRLPHWRDQKDAHVILKNLLYLLFLRSGLFAVVRKSRKASRGAIILYHRVNDYSRDPLSVDTRTFAAQLLAIAKYYPVMTSTELVRRIRSSDPIPPTSVLIHFDDAYRDVHTEGSPMLQAAGIPATAFISSGFVDTDRRFEHDIAKYPFRYQNCHREDILKWMKAGFEIGAHTVNHVDLGKCGPEVARGEILDSRNALEQTTGQHVTLFSFPFGTPRNITPQAIEFVRESGCDALFSAHGGVVTSQTDVWDIPRFGISSVHKPLWLLMEIESLSLPALIGRLRRLAGRARQDSMPAPAAGTS